MANISLTNPHNVKNVLLTSSPKLGGSIDMSVFTNVEEFSCENNDITAFTGNNVINTITSLNVSNNLISGSFGSISNNTLLQTFKCNNNAYTGTFPDLTNNPDLVLVDGSFNLFDGTLPNFFNCSSLETVYLNDNSFTTLADSQIVTIDLTSGAGTFNVGDSIYQFVGGIRLSAKIANIVTNGSEQQLYLIDITDEDTGDLLFLSGSQYTDVFSGTGPLGVESSYNVTVVSNQFYIDGIQSPALTLEKGKIYKFAYPAGDQIKFSTSIDGIHTSGSEYTDGVSVDNTNNEVTFIVPDDAPSVLYYYGDNNPNMGNGITVTNSLNGEGVNTYYSVIGNTTTIPVVTESIQTFFCQNNSIDADIQDLFQDTYNNPPSLDDFRCSNNSLSGTIPDLSVFPSLSNFICADNNIANFLGTVTSILLFFNAQNNVLNQSAVDNILLEFDNAGASGGTLILDGTGNSAPTSGATNTNYTSLLGKGWTVNINT